MASSLEENSIDLFYFPNTKTTLHQTFHDIYQSPPDAVLQCEDHKIYVRRCLLSAASEYFNHAFQNSHAGACVSIENVKYGDLMNVLGFIYDGYVILKQSTIESFVVAAKALKVPIDENIAASFLTPVADHEHSTTDNDFSTLGNSSETLSHIPKKKLIESSSEFNEIEFEKMLQKVPQLATKIQNEFLTHDEMIELERHLNHMRELRRIFKRIDKKNYRTELHELTQVASRTRQLQKLKSQNDSQLKAWQIERREELLRKLPIDLDKSLKFDLKGLINEIKLLHISK